MFKQLLEVLLGTPVSLYHNASQAPYMGELIGPYGDGQYGVKSAHKNIGVMFSPDQVMTLEYTTWGDGSEHCDITLHDPLRGIKE
jgi:hypothetical protein